jgi:hypothetical protein
MTTETTTVNGRPERKTLSSQIDRLDTILDGLADGLGEAVREAVAKAVTQAVEVTLKEVLSNPEMLRALLPQPLPAQPVAVEVVKEASGGSLSGRLSQAWQTTKAAVSEKATQTGLVLSRAWTWFAGCMQAAWTTVRSWGVAAWQMLAAVLMVLWAYRKPVLVAGIVGLVVGLGCYLAGPLVASLVSGLMAFLGALVVNLLRRLQQLMEAVRVRSNWLG